MRDGRCPELDKRMIDPEGVRYGPSRRTIRVQFSHRAANEPNQAVTLLHARYQDSRVCRADTLEDPLARDGIILLLGQIRSLTKLLRSSSDAWRSWARSSASQGGVEV